MNLLNQSTSETGYVSNTVRLCLAENDWSELSGGVIPSSIEGEIVFSNVVFRYPSRPTKIILGNVIGMTAKWNL